MSGQPHLTHQALSCLGAFALPPPGDYGSLLCYHPAQPNHLMNSWHGWACLEQTIKQWRDGESPWLARWRGLRKKRGQLTTKLCSGHLGPWSQDTKWEIPEQVFQRVGLINVSSEPMVFRYDGSFLNCRKKHMIFCHKRTACKVVFLPHSPSSMPKTQRKSGDMLSSSSSQPQGLTDKSRHLEHGLQSLTVFFPFNQISQGRPMQKYVHTLTQSFHDSLH